MREPQVGLTLFVDSPHAVGWPLHAGVRRWNRWRDDAAREPRLRCRWTCSTRFAAPSPSAPGGTASPLDLAAVGLAGAGLLQLARGEIVGSASEIDAPTSTAVSYVQHRLTFLIV